MDGQTVCDCQLKFHQLLHSFIGNILFEKAGSWGMVFKVNLGHQK